MRAVRARLMFSSDARAFLRSGVPLFVRTRPFDTVQNNADNSLSLRFCSSWFKISFIVSSNVRGPGMEPFMLHGPHAGGLMFKAEKPEGDHPGLHLGDTASTLASGI